MSRQRNALAERVYALVARIPEGCVTTYGLLARRLGAPNAARTVGWAMHRSPDGLPWHRVVAASGRPGGEPSSERVALQWALLADEGVVPEERAGRASRIDLLRYGWDLGEEGDVPMSCAEDAIDG
jgi:methylated-DNA-protein-cysteine methyltransferase related protein